MGEQGIDLGFTDEHLKGACHVCVLFDDDAHRRRIVTDYVAAGIAHRELVRYLADATPPETIRGWLSEKGVDVQAAEASGCFAILEAAKVYCPSGRFEPETMIAGNKERYVVAEKAGFTASRICGEMSWALGDRPGAERMLEYEAMLNLVDVPFRHFGVCQYDTRRFDGATLHKVLQVHPYMVAQGQIVRNPYYIQPQEFLAGVRASRGAPA